MMKHIAKYFMMILGCAAACVIVSCSEKSKINYFKELPLGSIGVDGWLEETLMRQANGATGHLDELYSQVMGPRNGWRGGDGDQWERGPYWIDGLLPLAYVLNDSTLIAKTTPWIEWILASQQPSGQFGPSVDYDYEPGIQRDNCQDWWPRMVVLKILQQYYSATSDSRVIDLLTSYFKYQLADLDEHPLDNWTFWARYRGADNLMVVYWLYSITGDSFLLDLGKKIYDQTEPYTEQFLERDRLTKIGSIHSVNLAQGIKTPIIYYQFDPQQKYLDAVDCALEDLKKFQGYPVGTFSGDETIHGNDPTQGTELCTIVEYMFSLENMYRITGDPKFAEILEKVAYNALPTQTTDDYMTRQYYQQVNQIRIARVDANFDCFHGVDNCYGLLTGYPCCTSNMHQGWPKFVQNTWYATNDGGLAAVQYAPTHVDAEVADGVCVRLSEETTYPFGMTVLFTVQSISRSSAFPLVLRIPSWSTATSVKVNGEEISVNVNDDNLARIDRVWSEGDQVEVEFTPEVRLSVWKENSRSVERGPLVYALNIKSEKRYIHNTFDPSEQGLNYYEYHPVSDWNYALIQCDKEKYTDFYQVDDSVASEVAGYPWNPESAPVRMKAKVVKCDSWQEYKGMAGPLPYSLGYGKSFPEAAPVELIPYGCSILRITEFPYIGAYSSVMTSLD